MENPILVDSLSQAAGPNNQAQKSGTISSVTIYEPQKKGRRKLNKTIFDVDTAAALRTKTQTRPQTIEVKIEANNPQILNNTVQQKAADVIHPSVQLPWGSPEIPVMKPALNAENSVAQAQTEDVSH